MYDFINRIKDELLLDIFITKSWNNQHVLIIDSENALELINYIPEFVDNWNIKIREDKVSASDIISDDLWYSL